jgi:LacI family transcriptional regulator
VIAQKKTNFAHEGLDQGSSIRENEIRREETVSGTPKVALLIETSRGFGRALLRGIVRYARLHGPWAFYVTPGDFEQVLPLMKSWGGTGIIARIETPEVARAILDSGLPTIALDLSREQLRPDHPLSRLSEVASDSRGAARMAAEHLLECGLRHYAYVGIPGRVWSQRRQESFVERIREAGFEPHIYVSPRPTRDRVWEREQPILARWLGSLPRPVGLLACNDDRGREVLEACRAGELRVPEEVAVIGVDDDELLCDLADPPLSSVALNAEAGGYRVAALLDRMMRARSSGQAFARRPRRLLVEALHVVTRRSTDIVALDDFEVAAALRFLHDRAAEPIGVSDVVRHLSISRRSLEIRFRKTVGRTIREELERARLERARCLLLETEHSISRVAEAAGFASSSYLAQVFRRNLGTTPARFRRQGRTPQV